MMLIFYRDRTIPPFHLELTFGSDMSSHDRESVFTNIKKADAAKNNTFRKKFCEPRTRLKNIEISIMSEAVVL